MTTSEYWLNLLRSEVGRSSIAATAKLLGYSRPSISLVLAGRYPGDTGRIAKAVLAKLDTQTCPHLGGQISSGQCREIALAAAPTHHPMKLGHWRACQRCPNRPASESQGD